MTINIYQIPPGADFNPCGCGSTAGGAGGAGGDGSGLPPPGSTTGGAAYSGQARVIDICQNVATIFQDSIAAWINTVQTLGYIPGGVESVVPSDISNFVLDAIDELESELYGDAYTLALKKWIVNRFDDPFPGFGVGWDGIFAAARSRAQLLNHMPLYPLVVAGAPFKHALEAWAYTADIQALNKRIADSAGTASLNGECADLQRQAGREPYQPPQNTSQDYETIEFASGNLRAYRFVINQNLVGETLPLPTLPAGETIVTGASFNCYLTGQPGGFAGQQVRWLDDGDATYKQLFDTTFGSSGDTGTWLETTVTDPAVQPFLDELYATFGQGGTRQTEAYTEPPGTTAGAGIPSTTSLQVWDNPTPPASSPGTWAGEIFVITSYT